MDEYDLISIGTGSAMSIVTQALRDKPDLDVAVIENKAAGGICLTRGCIPSKMLLYPAEVVNHINEADRFGIDAEINSIDFKQIMDRMREHVRPESEQIRKNLEKSDDLDFYHENAKFIDDYTLKVGKKTIKGDKIILGIGSRISKPAIDNLEKVGYLTSETLLDLEELPESVIVIGGGYIAAEYGYFLSMMGSDVTIVGRNPQFVPSEEENVSNVLQKKLSKYMDIHTGFEVEKVGKKGNKKAVIAENADGEKRKVKASEILLAAGRRSNADILEPHKSGIKTDEKGWIKVNGSLETTKSDIWALGDATGEHMFKHVANYEAEVVYENAFGEGVREVDYHAVPHAVFTHPQVASVGMKEKEARQNHEVLIGYYPFENTAKGSAMDIEDYFVKVIVEESTYRILGAHIVGPHASILIQEIIDLMNTPNQNMTPIFKGMHIHPSLSEVVERAFSNLHSHDHESHSHEHDEHE
ncbi:MAG: dihydrolipoyl dehydrogenase [Candidatus Thermoplasmatota archaeon]|nr:dihydrolipoyl dehydrogenase [Candidatus Thermoplasmatota archaeon]